MDQINFKLSFGLENLVSSVPCYQRVMSLCLAIGCEIKTCFLSFLFYYPVNFIQSASIYKMFLVLSSLLRYLWNKSKLCSKRHRYRDVGASQDLRAVEAHPCAAAVLKPPGQADLTSASLSVELCSSNWNSLKKGAFSPVFLVYGMLISVNILIKFSKLKNIC